MRWKFFRDTQSMYTCLWCCHVKLGSLLLGICSLLLQLSVLSLVIVAFFHPGTVPTWISSFVTPSSVNESQNVIHVHELPLGKNSEKITSQSGGSLSAHHRNMMGNDMMSDEYGMDESSDEEKIEVGDLPLERNTSHIRGATDMMAMGMDSKLSDGSSPSNAPSMPVDAAGVRDLMQKPSGIDDMSPKQLSQLPDLYNSDFDLSPRHSRQMDSDDKFLLFVILVGSIVASLMLIKGVIKSQPSYLMPYMGLQVFEFSVTGLTVFSCFSYLPGIKHWISVQPDSMPLKSYLMSMDTDRLILGTILLSVFALVIKAYFMGIVWSCYKYLMQNRQEATQGRRRLTDEDIRNPEDAELLLPPKYEDIVNTPASSGESASPPPPPPPPYQSA